MRTQERLVRETLEGSAFLIDFESGTESTYRCRWRGEILRSLHVDQEKLSVLYVLVKRGAPAISRIERFETLQELTKSLPTGVASFDLKFMPNFGSESSESRLRSHVKPAPAMEDPWDLARCFHRPVGGRLSSTDLRLAD